MAERRGGRLDTPREQRRPLIRTPAYDRDAFGVFAEADYHFVDEIFEAGAGERGMLEFLLSVLFVVLFNRGWFHKCAS